MDAGTPSTNRYAARVKELGGELPAGYVNYGSLQATEEDFVRLERQIGAVLPADFKEFMRDYGLYEFPEQARYLCEPVQYEAGILPTFFSVKLGIGDPIFSYYNDLTKDEYWLRWLLPFARDGNNYISIAFADEDYGAIYVCDLVSDPLYRIADSFDQFFNSIYLADEDKED